MIPTILGMMIEEVCAIFAPPPNFFFIRSLVSLLGTIQNLWENAYNLLFVPKSDEIKT